MPYQRAFSTLGCGELSLREAIRLAVRHGLDAIEVRAIAGSLDLPAALTAECENPDGLARTMAQGGIRLACLDTSLRLIGGTDAERTDFLRFAPWAEATGARWLRVFDGGSDAREAEIAAGVECLAWWRKLRAERGWQVDMMIETHDSLFTAEKIQRLVRAVPGVAILWDAHHTWKQGGEDPVKTWAEVGRHVVHIHVKDSISQPDAEHPYTYVLPGSGEFPARSLFATLQAEFAGVVSLEWERWWHPALPPLETALAAAARGDWW